MKLKFAGIQFYVTGIDGSPFINIYLIKMKTKYKLAIVTATLDSDENIVESFNSIHHQLKNDVCWIIKDSQESSSTLLNQYSKEENIFLLSQKDNSLYDGLNQAVNYINTEYFIVLGAGDKLADNAINIILTNLNHNSSIDIFFFSIFTIQNSSILKPIPNNIAFGMSVPHPGVVMKKENFLKLNGFDTRYQIASDYDLISRYLLTFSKIAWSDDVVSIFKGGGMSEKRWLIGQLEECLIMDQVHKIPYYQILNKLKIFTNSI